MSTRESSLGANIKKKLKDEGFFVIKIHGTVYSVMGFPDYIAMRKYRQMVFIETKSGSRLTKIQRRIHGIIEAIGFHVVVTSDSKKHTIDHIIEQAG